MKFDMNELVRELRNLKADDVGEAGPRTCVLAELMLLIARSYLLEMMKSEGSRGIACEADDLLAKATEILHAYDPPVEH